LEQLARIEALLAREDITLTDWESNFLKDVVKYAKKKDTITPKQWSTFQHVEARYSEEVIAARKAWYDDWNEEKAHNARAAAEYYRHNPPYFSQLADRILDDPKFIPSEKQYNKLVTNNKFVQKVLAMLREEPKYENGSLVQIRKTAPIKHSLRDRPAIVVKNDGIIVSHAKGARGYVILPFGMSDTMVIQERYLKKKRG